MQRRGGDRPRVPPKPARPMGKVLKVSLAGLSAPQDARTNGSEWGRPRRSHPPRSMRRDSVAATSSIRSSAIAMAEPRVGDQVPLVTKPTSRSDLRTRSPWAGGRSEEHTSELQSHVNLVCRLLLEKKKRI